MYLVQTIGALGDATAPLPAPAPPASTSPSDMLGTGVAQGGVIAGTVFAGCTNPNQIAAYLAAQAFERQMRGAVVGFFVGALVVGGAALYLKNGGKIF